MRRPISMTCSLRQPDREFPMTSLTRIFLIGLLHAITSAQADARLDDAPGIDPVSLIRTHAGAHRLVLLGEMHGTREVPALVGRLVTAYSADEPVLLGLEIHRTERRRLRRYLDSDGSADDMAALSGSAYWRVAPTRNDGRRTREMLELIEQVRALRADGRNVDIVLYDPGSDTAGTSEARDLAMANEVRTALSGLSHGRLLILTGNVHAILERPSFAPPEMQTPMGSYLRDLDPYSVHITASSGQFWACAPTCKAQTVSASKRISGPMEKGPWSLQIVLPRFTVATLTGDT